MDDKKLAELEKAWKDAMTAAQKYVVENQFWRARGAKTVARV